MTASSLQTPLYQRVFAVLYQRIQNGEYPVGSVLDSEDQLAAQFSVSKATIRKATEELVARGCIERRQGRGTFVREGAVRDAGDVFVGSLTDLISGTPRLPVRTVEVEPGVRFPDHVRAELGMEREVGTVIRTTRTVSAVPFVYSTHYLSSTIEGLVSESRLGTDGLLTLLHHCGVDLRGAEQSVAAQLADVDVASRLEVELGAPVLFAKRILDSANGPVDVLHSWYRGDRYEWRSRLDITWGGAGINVAPHPDQETSAAPNR